MSQERLEHYLKEEGFKQLDANHWSKDYFKPNKFVSHHLLIQKMSVGDYYSVRIDHETDVDIDTACKVLQFVEHLDAAFKIL